jgi:hypothetical protein
MVLYCNWIRCACQWLNVEKSEEFATKLGHKDCQATDGWLSQWKSRHDIKLKEAHMTRIVLNNENP